MATKYSRLDGYVLIHELMDHAQKVRWICHINDGTGTPLHEKRRSGLLWKNDLWQRISAMAFASSGDRRIHKAPASGPELQSLASPARSAQKQERRAPVPALPSLRRDARPGIEGEGHRWAANMTAPDDHERAELNFFQCGGANRKVGLLRTAQPP